MHTVAQFKQLVRYIRREDVDIAARQVELETSEAHTGSSTEEYTDASVEEEQTVAEDAAIATRQVELETSKAHTRSSTKPYTQTSIEELEPLPKESSNIIHPTTPPSPNPPSQNNTIHTHPSPTTTPPHPNPHPPSPLPPHTPNTQTESHSTDNEPPTPDTEESTFPLTIYPCALPRPHDCYPKWVTWQESQRHMMKVHFARMTGAGKRKNMKHVRRFRRRNRVYMVEEGHGMGNGRSLLGMEVGVGDVVE